MEERCAQPERQKASNFVLKTEVQCDLRTMCLGGWWWAWRAEEGGAW